MVMKKSISKQTKSKSAKKVVSKKAKPTKKTATKKAKVVSKKAEPTKKVVRKPKEEKVEYMTDEMMRNIFLFQPALSAKFSSSGKAVMKSVKLGFR
jgi:hypothetical protein